MSKSLQVFSFIHGDLKKKIRVDSRISENALGKILKDKFKIDSSYCVKGFVDNKTVEFFSVKEFQRRLKESVLTKDMHLELVLEQKIIEKSTEEKVNPKAQPNPNLNPSDKKISQSITNPALQNNSTKKPVSIPNTETIPKNSLSKNFDEHMLQAQNQQTKNEKPNYLGISFAGDQYKHAFETNFQNQEESKKNVAKPQSFSENKHLSNNQVNMKGIKKNSLTNSEDESIQTMNLNMMNQNIFNAMGSTDLAESQVIYTGSDRNIKTPELKNLKFAQKDRVSICSTGTFQPIIEQNAKEKFKALKNVDTNNTVNSPQNDIITLSDNLTLQNGMDHSMVDLFELINPVSDVRMILDSSYTNEEKDFNVSICFITQSSNIKKIPLNIDYVKYYNANQELSTCILDDEVMNFISIEKQLFLPPPLILMRFNNNRHVELPLIYDAGYIFNTLEKAMIKKIDFLKEMNDFDRKSSNDYENRKLSNDLGRQSSCERKLSSNENIILNQSFQVNKTILTKEQTSKIFIKFLKKALYNENKQISTEMLQVLEFLHRNNTQELTELEENLNSNLKCAKIVYFILSNEKIELRKEKLRNNLKSEMKLIYLQIQGWLINNDKKNCKNFHIFVDNANYLRVAHVFEKFVVEYTDFTDFQKSLDEELTKYLELGPINEINPRFSNIFSLQEIYQIEQLKICNDKFLNSIMTTFRQDFDESKLISKIKLRLFENNFKASFQFNQATSGHEIDTLRRNTSLLSFANVSKISGHFGMLDVSMNSSGNMQLDTNMKYADMSNKRNSIMEFNNNSQVLDSQYISTRGVLDTTFGQQKSDVFRPSLKNPTYDQENKQHIHNTFLISQTSSTDNLSPAFVSKDRGFSVRNLYRNKTVLSKDNLENWNELGGETNFYPRQETSMIEIMDGSDNLKMARKISFINDNSISDEPKANILIEENNTTSLILIEENNPTNNILSEENIVVPPNDHPNEQSTELTQQIVSPNNNLDNMTGSYEKFADAEVNSKEKANAKIEDLSNVVFSEQLSNKQFSSRQETIEDVNSNYSEKRKNSLISKHDNSSKNGITPSFTFDDQTFKNASERLKKTQNKSRSGREIKPSHGIKDNDSISEDSNENLVTVSLDVNSLGLHGDPNSEIKWDIEKVLNLEEILSEKEIKNLSWYVRSMTNFIIKHDPSVMLKKEYFHKFAKIYEEFLKRRIDSKKFMESLDQLITNIGYEYFIKFTDANKVKDIFDAKNKKFSELWEKFEKNQNIDICVYNIKIILDINLQDFETDSTDILNNLDTISKHKKSVGLIEDGVSQRRRSSDKKYNSAGKSTEALPSPCEYTFYQTSTEKKSKEQNRKKLSSFCNSDIEPQDLITKSELPLEEVFGFPKHTNKNEQYIKLVQEDNDIKNQANLINEPQEDVANNNKPDDAQNKSNFNSNFDGKKYNTLRRNSKTVGAPKLQAGIKNTVGGMGVPTSSKYAKMITPTLISSQKKKENHLLNIKVMPFLKNNDPIDYDPTDSKSQISAMTGNYSTISKFTSVGRTQQLRENLINKFYQNIDTKDKSSNDNFSAMQNLLDKADSEGINFTAEQKDKLFDLSSQEKPNKALLEILTNFKIMNEVNPFIAELVIFFFITIE